MKAKSVHICIFTNVAPGAAGGYDINALPSAERNLYQAASDAGYQVFQQNGYEGTTLSLCYAKAANFQQFLSTVSETPPFAAIAATYPGGAQKFYLTKSPAKVKNMLLALWSGDFGGSGTPGDLSGDGSGGGYGSGSNILCEIFPPLCSLGFWPWLALTAFVTYRTFEARSIVGRGLWGTAAFFTWKEFAARGGLKQLGDVVGIGKIQNQN